MSRGTLRRGLLPSRVEGVRSERPVSEPAPKMVVSFDDLDQTQIPPGSLLNTLQSRGKLSGIIDHLKEICRRTKQEAERDHLLHIYGPFPKNSKFNYPKNVAADVKWGVIRNVKSQKVRLAGYLEDRNIFHVVFFDMDHKFAPSSK